MRGGRFALTPVFEFRSLLSLVSLRIMLHLGCNVLVRIQLGFIYLFSPGLPETMVLDTFLLLRQTSSPPVQYGGFAAVSFYVLTPPELSCPCVSEVHLVSTIALIYKTSRRHSTRTPTSTFSDNHRIHPYNYIFLPHTGNPVLSI